MTALELRLSSELNFLLLQIAEVLQLTPTQYAKAEGHYQALAAWLSAKDSPLAAFDVELFPQGSMALGTTVKPLKSNEFDLDFVCRVRGAKVSSTELYALVHDRIVANAVYAARAVTKKRCVSLIYAGDFHVDIIPAIPTPNTTSAFDTYLLIPDRKLSDWTHSNPKGFIKWFKERSVVVVRKGLRADANVEPLPGLLKVEEKAPLAIAVQLVKRLRDRLFDGDDNAPRSIVLTTLAGLNYRGDESIVSALLDIADAIDEFIALPAKSLVNPANPLENFADRLDSEQTDKLAELSTHLKSAVSAMQVTSGLDAWRDVLTRYFGEVPVTAALERFGKMLRARRDQGTLTFGSAGLGVVVPAANRMPSNNYYGS